MDDLRTAVRIADVAEIGAARIYAAMLESAGIPAQLRGEPTGPLAMTLGSWAVTSIWVPAAARDDAVALLAGVSEPSLVLHPGAAPERSFSPTARRAAVAVVAIVVAAWAAALWL